MSAVLDSPVLTPPRPRPSDTEQRSFLDVPRTRQLIYERTLQAAQQLPALANSRHTLRLIGPRYADEGRYRYTDEKRAILAGETLGRRLVGTWELLDNNTGQVLDRREQTVARVPYLTGRGTFIHRGNEYTLSNQMRLRPGAFTRLKENGELEGHANIMPGRGVSHRYSLDPAKGIYRIEINQARIPLMPLLKALGATDKQIQEAWGNELWEINAQEDNPGALNKLYERVVNRRNPAADQLAKRDAVVAAFREMELDPEITRKTLGREFSRLDPEAILALTGKLLKISRGEAEPDDRDHLAFQQVLGAEDLLAERLAKDYGGLRRGLLHQASFRGNLSPVRPGVLSKQLEAALLHSGLGQHLEETNLAEVMDKQTRISRLGEGGIPSVDSVPDEARSVMPSHLAFIDPIRTPESLRAGVDSQIAASARKGSDGRLYTPLRNLRSGKVEYYSPQQLADLAVTFPGELKKPFKRVIAMKDGKLRFLPRQEIDLEVPVFEEAFSPVGNMVPMKSGIKPQRMAMAARMLTQALPLEEPEAPLVRGGIPGQSGQSYEEKYGSYLGALRAEKPGRVLKVEPDGIQVQYDDGTRDTLELYNNFPFNRKTFAHSTAVVQPGQTFAAGSLLARSNYTDAQGVAALGKNVRVAYLPFRGLNFEDAVVISRSLARKLKSEHMYQHVLEPTSDHKLGKRTFLGMYPGKFSRPVLETLDDDGVVQPGTVLKYGDPLILAVRRREEAKNKVHKKKQPGYQDVSELWEHHSPGVVTDVHKGRGGTTVLVKSLAEMQVGDKLSGRFGDKGIVSAIIDDDEMPHDSQGRPTELLLNPLGIISRTNPSQMVEAVLGKIAEKTGQPYAVQDFDSIDDLAAYAEQEAAKHGITDLEDFTDPETGRKIPGVFAGNRFIMKLQHTAEDKAQGRSTGGYSSEETPAKGGATGSKRISGLDVAALLSHGALEVLRDAGAVRGQRNEDYWLAFLSGHAPPQPKVPLVYQKFVNELKAAGINVIREGSRTNILSLTNKDIAKLAEDRVITNGETVRFDKGLEPVEGGLFDPRLTGGHHGERWAKIPLAVPLVNPVMEEPVRRLLGLTEKQFLDVLAGKHTLPTGTGPKGIQRALEAIDLDQALAVTRAQITSGRKTQRDQAVRRLGYLKSAQRLGLHPKDWVLDAVPVLPPKFRPVTVMGDKKLPLVADPNYLYKELLEANQNLQSMRDLVDDTGEEQLALYKAFQAVTGLAEPVHPKLQEKKVQGLLKHIFGSSPKYGTMQRKLLSSTVDLVGRAVISPNPDLDMDQVALPERQAWESYAPFVRRRLRRRGMSLVDAARAVEQQTSIARQELLAEMSERPVIINRAPVLHRFGIMAFWPRLTKNPVMEVSPLIVKGFGADFDGDAMQFHVPGDEPAKRQAIERMLPSRNLLSPADFKTPMHGPTQEYTGGLHHLTSSRGSRPMRYFRSARELRAAFMRGEVEAGDPVTLLE